MKFLNKFFSKKSSLTPEVTVTAPSINDQIEEYQAQILNKCMREREESIERLRKWGKSELEQTIAEYEEELTYCKITETPPMCRIFEEKIYQLKAAMNAIETNQVPA